jgi:hypothetical protein
MLVPISWRPASEMSPSNAARDNCAYLKRRALLRSACASHHAIPQLLLLWVLCHEQRRSKRRCVTVLEMKEGPSGSAIRSLIPSHRKLLWSKSMVVSVAEKSGR